MIATGTSSDTTTAGVPICVNGNNNGEIYSYGHRRHLSYIKCY